MKISPKIYWNWTIWVNVGEFGSIPVLLNLVGISSFLSDIRYDHLSSVDWPAQTPLPGSGRHSRSPRWWARSGICTQLPAPLFPRWREMDHLEGPLGPRCKWDFSHVLALITDELDLSVSVTPGKQMERNNSLNVIKWASGVSTQETYCWGRLHYW